MRAVVVVHPGSIFVSGAAEIAEGKLAGIIEGLHEEIREADALVVIDGMFSSAIPFDLQREIAGKLDAAVGNQEVGARVWGCDSGEGPYPAWQGRDGGFGLRHPDQGAAARAAANFLIAADEVIVTGAWATRDGDSGCVCDVADALRDAMPPKCRVSVSPNALFEEYRDEFSCWDDVPVDDEVAP
jgi:hypothetical protein